MQAEERDPDEPAERREPDYRFTLANERTFLAWLRTALALLAGAVAAVQLAPHFGLPGARTGVALALIALSLVVSVGSLLRWRAVESAVRRGEPLPRIATTWILSLGLAVITAFVGVVIAAGSGHR